MNLTVDTDKQSLDIVKIERETLEMEVNRERETKSGKRDVGCTKDTATGDVRADSCTAIQDTTRQDTVM